MTTKPKVPAPEDVALAAMQEAPSLKTPADVERMDILKIRLWLRTVHGVTLSDNLPDEMVRTTAAAHAGLEYIPRVQTTRGGRGGRAAKGYDTVTFFEGGPTEQTHVFLCVQGKTALVKRGVKVRVPVELRPAYQDAMQNVHTWRAAETGGAMGGEMLSRTVPAYPFTMHTGE